MDFRQFRTFVVTAEELHVGRAAERLGVAQPAVSQQIKALETALGFRVFHRVRRGIELTEAGAAFLLHAKAALANADMAVQAGRRVSRGESGKLCVAYVHSALLEPELPALLKLFSTAHPSVEIELSGISVREQVSALEDERIDIAFLRAPAGQLPASIKVTGFSRTPLDVVISQQHPASKLKRLRLHDLAGERLIVVDDPPGVGLGHRAIELCADAGIYPCDVLRTTDAISVVALASAGLGFGLVPRSLSRYGVEATVFKPLADANNMTEIIVATRKFDHTVLVSSFLDMVALTSAAAERARG